MLRVLTVRRILLAALVIVTLNLVLFYHVVPFETRLSFLRAKSRHLFCQQVLSNARHVDPSALAEPPRRPSANPDAPRARQVSAKSLIERSTANFAPPTEVSRIIHQSWKSEEVPTLMKVFVDSWRTTYPDFEYVLWTDEDNRDLVETRYPELLEAYESLKSEIYRADFIRNLYMHAFGGIYSDLDSESMTSILPTFQHYADTAMREGTTSMQGIAFLGAMDAQHEVRHSIPNAWMASTAGHPFWIATVERAAERALLWHEGKIDVYGPEYITGPVALRDSYYRWTSPNASAIAAFAPVVLIPSPLIYPYAWDDENDAVACTCSAETVYFDTEACKQLRPGGLVISYWGHSWGGNPIIKAVLEHTPWGTPKTPQPYR